MDRRTVVDGLGQAAGLLAAARRIVVFSGAGISTDSRIIL
jgi:NAD-dependent SIR2 family protein deacetylase